MVDVDDGVGASDFWRVWDERSGAVVDSLHDFLSRSDKLGPTGHTITVEQSRAHGNELVDLLRQTTTSEGHNEADLAARIARYPSSITVRTWFEAAAVARRQLVPALIAAYGSEPVRLEAALDAMQRVADRVLSARDQEHLRAYDQVLAEQRKEIQQARLRFDRLAEAGILGVIVCDLVGNIKEANNGFLEMVGYSREELLSGAIKWGDMTPPEWRHFDDDAVEQLKATGTTRPWEKEYLHKDGSRVPILVGVAMLNESECVAFVLDITERKRIEELRARSLELENQNRRIQEASRLKSEFLANMSHELRTPLNSIIGFADLLFDGEVAPELPEHRELLGIIRDNGRHLLKLINEVLDLAKVEAGKLEFFPESLTLSRAIAEVTGVLRAIAADKVLSLLIDVDPLFDEVTLDPSRLKQVLYNYVSNAIKFTPEGGTITIRTRPEGLDAFRIEVEDTGIGVAHTDLGRLFVEFQQLDSGAAKKHAGTGLGLALTKRIVEAQGGSVGVKSVLGSGSVFFAVLPRLAARVSVETEPPPVTQGRRDGAAVVLVVDDDVRDQTLVVRTLTREGFGAHVVATGLEAVSACRERVFAAVTLDLLLPDITGLEVLRRIRTEGANRDTPVIILSVVAERGVIGGFAVQDYLQKPVDRTELVGSLQRAGVAPDRLGSVLVVDDDPHALSLMKAMLRRFGYWAEIRSDGGSALDLAKREPPLAVIVDLLMPGMDGFEFLEQFRRIGECASCPAIAWTMKDLTAADHLRLHRLAQAVVSKGEQSSNQLVEQLEALLSRRHVFVGAE